MVNLLIIIRYKNDAQIFKKDYNFSEKQEKLSHKY